MNKAFNGSKKDFWNMFRQENEGEQVLRAMYYAT
jgi:hypothetical protein